VRARENVSKAAKTEVSADPRFASISANSFFKVMFAESTKPEAKRAEVAKLLTFEGTKEQNRERIKEFELFKEYLQSQREEMAQEIIRLTDTGTFSELKQVYDDLNTSLIQFDERMQPLTDIIDAVYTLRTNGLTLDAFQEILRDRKREEELRLTKTSKQEEFDDLKSSVNRINSDIAALGEQRSFFGLGGVKEEARVAIARKNEELRQVDDRLSSLSDQLFELEKQTPSESELGEYVEQKKKLRELLDISADDHKQRR